jgi:hypothetical protein
MTRDEAIKKGVEEGELEVISDYEMHEIYEEMLDEVFPDCKIGGLSYSTSHAMKLVDETAYHCGFSDWLDSESETYEDAGNDYVKVADVDAYLEKLENEEVQS